MSMRRALLFLAPFSIVVFTACAALSGASPGSTATDPAVLPSVGSAVTVASPRPIDLSIAAVSRSDPSPAAQAALSACGASGPKGVGVTTAFVISGMGLVPHARDVPEYVPLWGIEPEIQTDKPAWVIQMAGRVDWGDSWGVDPVCVVIDGASSMFEPGTYGRGTQTVVPPTPSRSPTRALPPLAP